jgi:hypothetical protein
MPGAWGADGTYAMDDGKFVFSCASGVAAKCTTWGYPATVTVRGDTLHGDYKAVNGPDLILACTRMARADYCASGKPHTVDGTPIHLYDIFGGPVRPEHEVPGFKFEAAWTGQAWKTTDSGPAQKPAMCLSKLRWATLPVGGECPLTLPDPRYKGEGRFCEDYDQAELEKMGAYFYNDSPLLDTGLYTWSNDAGDAWLATTHLFLNRLGQPPEPLGTPLTPPDQVQLPGSAPRFEGALFRPEATPPDGAKMLSTYFCADVPEAPKVGGDFRTTTEAPEGCVKIGDEGWVYGANTASFGRVQLTRWERKVVNDNAGGGTFVRSLTSTNNEHVLIGQGWQEVAIEGYLPR